MNWTSLVLLSAVAVSVPGEAFAFRSAGDLPEPHRQLLATNVPAPKQSAPAKTSKTASASASASKSASPSADTSAELQKLEKRFFMHDFTQEPIEQRLQRMEKFTLGEVGTGTPDSRVEHLAAILEIHNADTKLASMPGVNPPRVPPTAASTNRAVQQQQQSQQPDATDYPHITYLEDNILGQDFPGQSLDTRLARLETKAFGAPSKDPDFSNRTDALERYTEIHLRKKPFDNHQPDRSFAFADEARADDGPAPSTPADVQPVDPLAMLPTPPPESARLLSRIAWCEQHTLGKTYPELHLLPRLHQLNAKLFPNDKTKDIQLMDHVDTIVKEVVLRQHPPTKQTS